MKTRAYIIIIASGVILFIVSWQYIAQPDGASQVGTSTIDGENTITERTVQVGSANTQDNGTNSGKTISAPLPALDRITVNNSALSPEVQLLLRTKMSTLSEDLLKNPAQLDKWIDLGILRKEAGDFDGARLVWEYVAAVSPTNSVVRGNLANLYAYDLNDSEKAKKYFGDAIRLSPTSAYLYSQAYEYYIFNLKDEELAVNVLVQAINSVSAKEAIPFKEELKKYQ